MMTQKISDRTAQLQMLCDAVRSYVSKRDYQNCVHIVCEAMGKFPDAPHPHNLLGIVLEKEGNHPGAMKHFRAACALDPTYLPARQNLEHFGTFYSQGGCAFDESDCPKEGFCGTTVEYDDHGVGHVLRKRY